MGRRERRRSHSLSSSSCSSSSSSDGDRGRHRSHKRSSSKSRAEHKRSSATKSKSRRAMGHGSRHHRDGDLERSRTPIPQVPLYTPEHKGPRVAMVLLLGPEEREFRLTEAHILFDSPNDLTSTYYASTESAEAAGPPRTYRLPDRDAAIFEIIYRYLNREQVLPLRRSACPTYLSYEQTLLKLAEEAKFYRFTKLQRALPPPPSAHGGDIATLTPPQYALQLPAQRRGTSSSRSSGYLPLPAVAPVAPSPKLPPAHLPAPPPGRSPAPIITHALPSPCNTLQLAPDGNSTSDTDSHLKAPSLLSSKRSSRAHSRKSSVPERPAPAPVQSLFAYIYRPGQFGVRRGDPSFELIDYPDDVPMPHLFIRIVNAEIKFSAFRNAIDENIFELRWSLRVLDEPSTRALAYRVHDSTIKAVDSHLRINGVVGDVACRDIPLQIRHAKPKLDGRHMDPSDYKLPASEDAGIYTSDLEELLGLISQQGYVKWPRIWQDTFDNVTPINSLHQRVCLGSCEVLLDLEFPEDTAEISAEVGGRGFDLDHEDEEDLLVRNYRAVLHGIKVDTRKMRRLAELAELDPDGRLAKDVSEKLSVGSVKHASNGHSQSQRRRTEPARLPRPSYHERHVSRASYGRESPRSDAQPMFDSSSSYQYPDPGTARTANSGYPGSSEDCSYHSVTGRPRSTASEDIKRRVMSRW